MLTKQIGCSFKDLDTKEGIVTGYFAHFGNIDSDGDIIVKGAFAKTIQENGPLSGQPRIKHLLDHDRTKGVGVLRVLQEDETGLYYESKAGSWSLGQDFIKMCDDGLITEHSIGYSVIKGNATNQAYELLELRLREGSSLQCWGANPMTPLTGVKSDTDLLEYTQVLKKALKNGTYTDETFIQLEKQFAEIQAFLQTKTTQPDPIEVTEDTTEPGDDEKQLSQFISQLRKELQH